MDTGFLSHIIGGNTILSYVLFGSILTIGIAFKRVFSRLLSKLFYRLFTRIGNHADPKVFVRLLLRPIELLLLLMVVYLAINQLNYPLHEVIFTRQITVDKAVSNYEVSLIQVIDKIFLFLFIVSVFWIVLRIIDFVAYAFMYRASQNQSRTEDQLIPFIKELSKITTIIFGIFVVMGTVFNLNVATIIAGLGIGGIAVALAAQDTLQNLLGSFTIFADKPFIVGDLVRLDKFEGRIEKVGFRSTWLRTADNTRVIIPNKKMVDSPLENLSYKNEPVEV
ncbi:MAG TPA: mechanosensitive ion channel domain-containing protein [Daejeonella sp.]|nr:mechanosensitive ion channel domain-containing protein [Daejeonella sp.]